MENYILFEINIFYVIVHYLHESLQRTLLVPTVIFFESYNTLFC